MKFFPEYRWLHYRGYLDRRRRGRWPYVLWLVAKSLVMMLVIVIRLVSWWLLVLVLLLYYLASSACARIVLRK